jgi:hypothetical protein
VIKIAPMNGRRALAVIAMIGAVMMGQPDSRAVKPGKERVAVLGLAISGDAPPELRNQMQKSLDGGLAVAGYEVVPHDELMQKLKGNKELEGCFSTTCLERLTDLVGARRFVNARVDASGASYTIELQLLGADASSGIVQRLEKSCPVCTITEANNAMSKTAAMLTGAVTPTEPAPLKITVRTTPPGLPVSIDDAPAGNSPAAASVKPGEHHFRVSPPKGYLPADLRRTITVDGEVLVTLEKIPEQVEITPPPSSRFGAWKWVGVAGAAGTLGTGIYLLAIQGKGTDCVASGACRSTYSNLPQAIGLLAGGAAISAFTVYMFTHDTRAPEAAIVPLKGGAAVVFGTTF